MQITRPPAALTYADLMQMLSRNDHISISEEAMYRLRDVLAERLRVQPSAFDFDFDLNYSRAYTVLLYVDGDCLPVSQQHADFGIAVMRSRIADVFTFIGYKRIPATPRPIFDFMHDLGELPPCLQQWRRIITSELESQGHHMLEGNILRAPVAEYVPELPGTAADVFSLLFSEIY